MNDFREEREREDDRAARWARDGASSDELRAIDRYVEITGRRPATSELRQGWRELQGRLDRAPAPLFHRLSFVLAAATVVLVIAVMFENREPAPSAITAETTAVRAEHVEEVAPAAARPQNPQRTPNFARLDALPGPAAFADAPWQTLAVPRPIDPAAPICRAPSAPFPIMAANVAIDADKPAASSRRAPARTKDLSDDVARYRAALALLRGGQAAAAAEAFATYLRAHPTGALVESATLSRFEALHRAGAIDTLRDEAGRWLRAHPDHPRASELRALLNEW